MRGSKGDFARISHIIEAIQEIELYTENADFDAFLENSMMRYACIKQLEIIGEASNSISDEIKNNFVEIEWKQIKGMRNIFVHEYFGIDPHVTWDIIIFDLPDLKEKVSNILSSLQN